MVIVLDELPNSSREREGEGGRRREGRTDGRRRERGRDGRTDGFSFFQHHCGTDFLSLTLDFRVLIFPRHVLDGLCVIEGQRYGPSQLNPPPS